MKTQLLLFIFLFCNFSFLNAQTSDTVGVWAEVDSLTGVVNDWYKKRDYDKALVVNEITEKIVVEKLGKETAEYGNICLYMGRIFRKKANYSEAEKWHLESIDIYRKVLGKEHPKYATSLNECGILYWEKGNFEKAEPLYLEAKNIHEKTIGKEHPDYAKVLNNIGVLNIMTGDYEKAEKSLLEAKNIREKTIGKEHPHYSTTLNNLGNLYRDIGDYKKAEKFLLESLSIKRKVHGNESRAAAMALNNLGLLYRATKYFEKAEKNYLESLNIKEKIAGKEHPVYASALHNLGALYLDLGDIEKAEELLEESLNIREKINGKEHRIYAINLSSLGVLNIIKGDFEKAEMLIKEANSIFLAQFGNKNILYLRSVNDLARLYMKSNEPQKSLNLFLEAITIDVSSLAKEVGYLSEKELAFSIDKYFDTRNKLYSLTKANSNHSGRLYDNSLFYKGFLQNTAGQIKRLTQTDSTNTEIFYELKSYQRRLAKEYSKPIAERNKVEELEEKANAKEKELARTTAGYGHAIRQVEWQEVQQSLKLHEAAIEFVHYRYYKPKGVTDSTMYAALLLRPGFEQPKFISLFEEKEMDILINKNGTRRSDYVNGLYQSDKASLYDLIWKPLEKELEGAKNIYYSPSGLLHLLNLNSLPTGGESMVSDQYDLHLLNSTRQLVVHPEPFAQNNIAVLFGGIRYEADSAAIAYANSEFENMGNRHRGALNFSQSDSTLRGDHIWKYLQSSADEIKALEPILKKGNFHPQGRKAFSATEKSFKTLGKTDAKPSPRIIHLATHGYFFPNPTVTHSEIGNEPIFKISEHPMIRSGLILAGGNHAWKNGKPMRPETEDGILTAYEISQMDLSDTELVVLSACETGLGDIKGNEGVYGLQRAFKIAGVKNIVMSLWQVPDYHTKELMIRFYYNWLEEKMEIGTALLTAQNSLREEGYEPFYWAGFVVLE